MYDAGWRTAGHGCSDATYEVKAYFVRLSCRVRGLRKMTALEKRKIIHEKSLDLVEAVMNTRKQV